MKLSTEHTKSALWWSCWLMFFLVALFPWGVHRFLSVKEVVDPYRYRLTSLLPAELLLLKQVERYSLITVVGVFGLMIASASFARLSDVMMRIGCFVLFVFYGLLVFFYVRLVVWYVPQVYGP